MSRNKAPQTIAVANGIGKDSAYRAVTELPRIAVGHPDSWLRAGKKSVTPPPPAYRR
jgi:hypothetical protein